MKYFIINNLCTIITALVVNKIVAIYYMKIIDSYVNDIVAMLKELIRTTYVEK